MRNHVEYNRSYAAIGRHMIKTDPVFEDLRDSGVRIAYLSSQEEKRKNGREILGECVLVKDQYRWCVPYDFMIFIYEPNCLWLDEKQKRILIMHELMHVGIDQDSDEIRFRIVPHDVEEFWTIINRYGLTWDIEQE